MKNTTLKLSDLLDEIKEVVDGAFYDSPRKVLVEVSDVKNYHQRFYCFFRVIEKSGSEIIAQADAVIWRNEYETIQNFEKQTGIKFSQDIEIVVDAFVTFHPRWGLKLQVIEIDPGYTIGKLELERRKTIEKLCLENPHKIWIENEELHSFNKSLELKDTIKRVALISAPDSDGRRDFLHEMINNIYGITYQITLFDASVQGVNAASQIAGCLDVIDHYKEHFDAIAIVRGGGGNTDLGAFDQYDVSLKVASSALPIFTGIGHERNVSIADQLAHTAMKTPTKCASAISEHNAYELGKLELYEQQMIHFASMKIQKEKNSLERLITSSFPVLQKRILQERLELEKIQNKMMMLNPIQYLNLGLALVFQGNKRVRKITELTHELDINIKMIDGFANLKLLNKNGKETN